MAELPKYGKVTKEFFESVIYPNLGAKRANVLTGPKMGLDNCIINVGGGQVLVASTDPLSFLPEIGPGDSAWLSIHAIASDIATSGFSPQYAIFDFNLPSTIGSSIFETYWRELSKECENLGIAIVGGHTSRFEGINSTIIGGGTIFSFGSSRSCLTPAGANVGDDVVVTKGAAIESTGVLSMVFPNTIRAKIGEELHGKAQGYLRMTSVVKDALTAIKVGTKTGGVSAMHDATEGGVLAALYELANASSLGLRVDKKKIRVSRETSGVCELFGIDPYISLSEGSLVFSCNPGKAASAVAALGSIGVEASIVGQLVDQDEGVTVVDENERTSSISYPIVDPYWKAYYSAKEKGWT
jgi:hydrogenase expression/formation protein HypE